VGRERGRSEGGRGKDEGRIGHYGVCWSSSGLLSVGRRRKQQQNTPGEGATGVRRASLPASEENSLPDCVDFRTRREASPVGRFFISVRNMTHDTASSCVLARRWNTLFPMLT